MIKLVLDKCQESFSELVKELSNSLRRQINSFTYDQMLCRTEDKDSLYNFALLKLWDAVNNFKYDEHLTEEHNQRRFLAMVKKYVRNDMIDRTYAANVDKRKPRDGFIAIEQDNDDTDEKPNPSPALLHKGPSAVDICIAKELYFYVRDRLKGDERRVYELVVRGHQPEVVSGKLGVPISRVRYIIYEKIQPTVRSYYVTSE